MKVYVILADGFEEIEAVTVVDVLRRAKIDVTTVSISKHKEVVGAHSITIYADVLFNRESLKDGDMIVLPGGMPGTTNLGAHVGLALIIKEYAEKDKWLAAICAAPSVLGKMGLLKGKAATCYPGCEGDLLGARYGIDRVIVDGKIVTSRGPGTAIDFSLKLVEILKGTGLSDQIRIGMLA